MFGEKQRRWITLLTPPAEDGLDGAQFRGRDFGEHGKNVVIGKLFVVIAGSAGAVKDDRNEARIESLAEFFDNLVEIICHWHPLS